MIPSPASPPRPRVVYLAQCRSLGLREPERWFGYAHERREMVESFAQQNGTDLRIQVVGPLSVYTHASLSSTFEWPPPSNTLFCVLSDFEQRRNGFVCCGVSRVCSDTLLGLEDVQWINVVAYHKTTKKRDACVYSRAARGQLFHRVQLINVVACEPEVFADVDVWCDTHACHHPRGAFDPIECCSVYDEARLPRPGADAQALLLAYRQRFGLEVGDRPADVWHFLTGRPGEGVKIEKQEKEARALPPRQKKGGAGV